MTGQTAKREMEAKSKMAPPRIPKIPLFHYIKFQRAKDRNKTEFLNDQLIDKEIKKEEKIAKQLEKQGLLFPGNGLDVLLEVCRRRLSDPTWYRIVEHSHNVRKIAYCIAQSWQKLTTVHSEPLDHVALDTIERLSGYHDIGKTFITPYLVNREDGTWLLGIGKGQRIDFQKELWVLRLAHIEAGSRLLEIYEPYMGPGQYETAKWVIGGHHLAYNGVGSAGAPSYPEVVNGINVKKYIERNRIPLPARIMRTADLYCAILENRFYLAESERIVTKVKNMDADDSALAMLITVAGTDVDPAMVGCLLMGKYKLEPEIAELVVEYLSCKREDILSKRGGDIKYSLERVIPQEVFQAIVNRNPGTDWERYSRQMREAPPLI